MASTLIECPKCRRRFTLNAGNLAAVASRPFRCPKCGFAAPFGQLMNKAGQPSAHPRTHIAGGSLGDTGGKTKMVSADRSVLLLIENSGRSFPVPQGSYTLGRESSDSCASLKIAPDPYMSRLHARFDVGMDPGGMPCRITALNSANAVFVNNRRLECGQTEELHDGDRILLGMTTLRLRVNKL